MNQNPEQLARDRIDAALVASGWLLQDKKSSNLAAATGIAIREYSTVVGPADYVLFVNRKPVGIIEAKRDEEGVGLTVVEEQSTEYASAKLKYMTNEPLAFVCESTYDGMQTATMEIESRLSVCDKVEETINDSLKQAAALRQSILKKAFEGKLLK